MILSVSAPASSANLGAGFDVFGMALSLRVELGVGKAPQGAHPLRSDHPARVPFERLGGTGNIWLRTDIPMARGLGYSGATRIAAAGLGAVVDADGAPDALNRAEDQMLAITAELEGHGDNVAASLRGGVTAYANGAVHSFPLGPTLGAASCLAWVPSTMTSTDASRLALPGRVDRSDAVANIAAATQFALAFAHDDPSLLAGSTADRLHQEVRLPTIPGAAEAITESISAGAWCAWLSGSGPTIAMLCPPEVVDSVTASLPSTGYVKRLSIDRTGVQAIMAPS